jgi:hypothetical protein
MILYREVSLSLILLVISLMRNVVEFNTKYLGELTQ